MLAKKNIMILTFKIPKTLVSGQLSSLWYVHLITTLKHFFFSITFSQSFWFLFFKSSLLFLLFCFGFLTKTKVKTNSVLPELGINWWLIMITNMTNMQLFCDSSWKLSGAEEAERCWVWVQSKRCWLLSL